MRSTRPVFWRLGRWPLKPFDEGLPVDTVDIFTPLRTPAASLTSVSENISNNSPVVPDSQGLGHSAVPSSRTHLFRPPGSPSLLKHPPTNGERTPHILSLAADTRLLTLAYCGEANCPDLATVASSVADLVPSNGCTQRSDFSLLCLSLHKKRVFRSGKKQQ